MTDKLKPCPLCGGESWLTKRKSDYDGTILYGGRCINTGCCEIPAIYTKTAAISKWNTRKPMDRIVEQLEERKILCNELVTEAIGMNNLQLQAGARNRAVAFKEAIAIAKGVQND